MKGYKGFDKDFKCRGFQYEVGKSYKTDKAIICENGFHFCENPLDVWAYYPPMSGNRFGEVTGSGQHQKHDEDTKVVCTNLHVEAEVNLKTMIEASVKFILSKVKSVKESNAATTGYGSNAATTGYRSNAATTGDWSNAATTGYGSNAATTGNGSNAATTGYGSNAAVSGKDSIACGLGYNNAAKGAVGCWLVLAERDDNYKIKSVKSVKVDGKKIRADQFYTLKNGKFVAVK